jgi:hypothetical protein
MSGMRRAGGFALVAGVTVLGITCLPPDARAFDVAAFSVTPSTTQASGHPDLTMSISFADPNAGVRDIALHLPAGLGANPTAPSFCSRKRLLADICPPNSKVGTITVAGAAFGFDITATNKIYNARPAGSERLRLAVPLYGSVSRPGRVAELPVTERPAGGGLDMAVTGLPSNVNGTRVLVKRVSFTLRGVARVRVRHRLRRSAFLTNPATCAPAISALEVTSNETPPASIARTSTFVPSGCG